MMRNLMDGLATESTLRRLLGSLHFARDSSDQLRVVLAGGGANVNALVMWNGGSYTTWYATGAPNSMDAREQMKAQARANVQQVRTTRWSIA